MCLYTGIYKECDKHGHWRCSVPYFRCSWMVYRIAGSIRLVGCYELRFQTTD